MIKRKKEKTTSFFFKLINLLKRKNSKGIAIYITIGLMAVILFMIFAIFLMISSQVKTVGEIGKSAIAFHSADTGIERLGEAIFVGYDYYSYPYFGECLKEEEKEEGVCSFRKCQPTIEFNSQNCGLPSKCDTDNDCICPKDQCVGFNFYDYPEHGNCQEGRCINCFPNIISDSLDCGYHQINCLSDNDCLCPIARCLGLDPNAVSSFPFKTPYYGTLPNGAKYETYILSPKSIKSIGEFKGISRAIEITF
jgi:hypothetical protein